MDNEGAKLNTPTEKEADTVFNAVVAASLRTLFWIFLAASVVISSLAMCLPYTAMRISYDLGMYKTSLAHAQRAINTGSDDKRINAMLKGIELSDKFLTEETIKNESRDFNKNQKKYAQKLLTFTDEYALSAGFDGRNAILDQYYRTHAATKYQKILLYSNKDYVYCRNIKARAVLGQADKLLYDGKIKTLDEIARLLPDIKDAGALAIIYNQIATFCRIEPDFKILYDTARQDPFYFYVPLTATIKKFLQTTAAEPDLLKKLYLADSAANLEYTLKQFKAAHNDLTFIDGDLVKFTIDGLSLEKYIEKEITGL